MFRNRGTALAHRLKCFYRMRNRYRVLFLAALVAALVVPVGFALSLDSTPVTSTFMRSAVASPAVLPSWSMPDGAKLFFVGTVLFGLAAAVRKAS
jgi:TRAP-type C4-dicarboxylate transport system permease small subunit